MSQRMTAREMDELLSIAILLWLAYLIVLYFLANIISMAIKQHKDTKAILLDLEHVSQFELKPPERQRY